MSDVVVVTIDGPHHLHVEKPRDFGIAVRALLERGAVDPLDGAKTSRCRHE